MPGLSHTTVSAWKERLGVDYFTEFIKAYILFNAWCHTLKPGVKEDKALLDHVKNVADEANTVRRKLLPLLRTSSDDAVAFHQRLNQLHKKLQNFEVGWDDERVTFTRVYIKRLRETEKSHESQGVQITVKVAQQGMTVKVYSRNLGRDLFTVGPGSYNWERLIGTRGYLSKTSIGQKQWLWNLYQQANPEVYANLINPVDADSLRLDEPEVLFSAIVDIVYKLRCRLFHGEEIPNPDTNDLYLKAHAVLMDFIGAI